MVDITGCTVAHSYGRRRRFDRAQQRYHLSVFIKAGNRHTGQLNAQFVAIRGCSLHRDTGDIGQCFTRDAACAHAILQIAEHQNALAATPSNAVRQRGKAVFTCGCTAGQCTIPLKHK